MIPAWNEEKYLPRLLDSIDAAKAGCRLGSGAVEVIVADNASTDGTAGIAEARGCRVVSVQKRAIAAARNGGAAIATGEILCFVDADSEVHPETFDAIHRAMGEGRWVAGATGVRLDRWSPGIFLTWCLLMALVAALKVDTGVVFCRREDFQAIGGYNEARLFAEDVEFLWSLRRLGRSRGQSLLRLKGTEALGSTRKFDKYGDWHYFTRMPALLLGMVLKTGRGSAFAQKYWYEDDR
ncbi:MAG: glycosyltransferase [Acidobacteria bacterium]|nr:glycosyltransferase [Acidobacteriota bacterium]